MFNRTLRSSQIRKYKLKLQNAVQEHKNTLPTLPENLNRENLLKLLSKRINLLFPHKPFLSTDITKYLENTFLCLPSDKIRGKEITIVTFEILLLQTLLYFDRLTKDYGYEAMEVKGVIAILLFITINKYFISPPSQTRLAKILGIEDLESNQTEILQCINTHVSPDNYKQYIKQLQDELNPPFFLGKSKPIPIPAQQSKDRSYALAASSPKCAK